MTQKQQSLSDSNSTDTDTEDEDNSPPATDIHNQIEHKQRVSILGLDNFSDAEWPDAISEDSLMRTDMELPFNEVVKTLLPNAERGTLHSDNSFVTETGEIDTEAINDVDGINTDTLSVDLDDVDASDRQQIKNYIEVVDKRREALAALGYDIQFRWQVATNSYTIINPDDAYLPAYQTLKQFGESDSVFGWVDTRDWGGEVNIYLLFEDKTINHPDDDDRDPIYFGLQTGYNFTSSRALDVQLFAYDSEEDVRLYNLGERRTRKHVGNPNDSEHERENGRTPIKEWWEEEYDNAEQWVIDVDDDIVHATETTINFSEFEFGLSEFYEYLDIAETYITGKENDPEAIGAVERARQHSPSGSTYSMWTLFYALSLTLEEEFQGSKRDGAAYKVYADIARKILRRPEVMIRRAVSEHRESAAEQQSESKREQLVNGDSDNQQITDIDEVDGVNSEDELGLVEKEEIATEKQNSLFNFTDDD